MKKSAFTAEQIAYALARLSHCVTISSEKEDDWKQDETF
jgi:hypothetical protein